MAREFGDILIAHYQDGRLLRHAWGYLAADTRREVCRLAPRKFKYACEHEDFAVQIAFGVSISLYGCGRGRALRINGLVYPAAPLIEVLLRLAQGGKQNKASRLCVLEGIVMLEIVADSAAYVGKTVPFPREVFPCPTDYSSRVQPSSGYRIQVVLAVGPAESDPIEVRMANTDRALQRRTKTVGNLGQLWLPPDRSRFDAVNGNVYIVEVVLRVDKRAPLFGNLSVNKLREADLAD